MGLLRASSRKETHSVWFELGERDGSPVAPAAPEDLSVPSRLRPALARMAAEWTPSTETREEKMEAIQRRLMREYRYSLEPRTDATRDPVMDFLAVSRAGHCGHFATALALLGRTVGVPTRLVLGYRVAERHPLLAHYVVRRKNAHAWVEAQMTDGRGSRSIRRR